MSPIMQLQQCLIESAMAGTNLLGENFRLKKAIDGLTPFATRNPIFKKIQDDTKKLLTLPKEEQGAHLLKTLVLVNAVAVTMAQTKVEDAKMLETAGHVGVYVEIPYNHMEQLRYALTQKGAGRIEIIQELWQQHPEYFKDYRVQEALLQGLKDPYIGFVVCYVIVKLGETMIPVLQDGLDYNGKREMGYRAWCMMTITGDETIKEEVTLQGCKAVKEAMHEAESFKFMWKRMELFRKQM